MALFGFKKKEKQENEEAQSLGKLGEQQEDADKEPEEQKPVVVPPARFSQRAAGIFGRMYRMILSVSLANNVCQIESGEQNMFGKNVPARMYFTDWCGMLSDNMAPADKERFAEEFSAEALCKALSSEEGGFEGVYAVGSPEELANIDQELHYWELRADKIPDAASVQTRCIIYIRELGARPQKYTHAVLSDEDKEREIEWNSVRIACLAGGTAPLFFEYDSREDIMYIHIGGSDAIPTEIMHYMPNLENRSDWTIFHSDVALLRSALLSACAGESKTIDIRYRAEAGKGKKFHIHRVVVAPADETRPVRWVVGIMTDIDEMMRSINSKQEITGQISMLIEATYDEMSEIDVEKDLRYMIYRSEDSFVRSENPVSLSAYINSIIANGVVSREYVRMYTDIISKGFLERKTLAGNYDMDVMLKRPGDKDYKWYSVTISKIAGSRYMVFTRDISEIQEARRKEAEAEESTKYAEYNRQMLDTIANLVEFRNLESGPHISRVRKITRIMLERVAELCPEYELTLKDIDLYSEAAVMHDIGKIVVPDHILNKEGKLTEEEWTVMKRHTTDGARILERLSLPGQELLLQYCKDVALHHHERFDGAGYPEGLEGENIAIGVQVIGLADSYDALVSERCYKEGLDYKEAIRMILNGECGAFNPKLLECFKASIRKMETIYGHEV